MKFKTEQSNETPDFSQYDEVQLVIDPNTTDPILQQMLEDDALQNAEDEKRAKAEIKRNNNAMVNELKSTVRTVIIALDRPISASEIQDSVEFFMDTAVDVKLINRALRALVKENRLEKNDNGSYQLPATRKHMFDTLAAYKSQNRPIGR